MSRGSAAPPLFQILAARARQRPDGILCYREDRAASNREVHDDALALGAALRSRFAGESVLGAMFKQPRELNRLIWASRAAELCLALLPVVTDPGQVRALMQEIGATHLLTDVPILSEQDFALSLIDMDQDDKLVLPHGSGRGPAFLLRTSGTTGTGKWVAVEDRQAMTVLEAMQETGALRHAEDQVAFLTAPLSHSYGLSTLFEYVLAGSAVVLPRGTSPLGPAGELRDGALAARITAIEGVASFYGQLARLLDRVHLPALRHVGFGGGPLDGRAVERLRFFQPALTYSVRYGMTETPSIVSGMVFHPPYGDDWSCSGRVLPVWELRIVDELGRPLPEGQEGEIQLRGAGLAWPYYGEGEGDGAFFPTGDVGVLVGGRLSIRGRKSLFLKHGGFRFSPEEVEEVIRLFDGVADVRVSMAEDGLTAELVTEDDDLPLQVVRTFAAARLPAYAVPKNLVRVAAIPRTESGKIRRGPGSVSEQTGRTT